MQNGARLMAGQDRRHRRLVGDVGALQAMMGMTFEPGDGSRDWRHEVSLSSVTTRLPRANACSTTADPMKPAPPVYQQTHGRLPNRRPRPAQVPTAAAKA